MELCKHQCGLKKNWRRCWSTWLFPSFQLNSSVSFHAASQQANPVNCLNLEQNEHRYLLSGHANGNVIIYDRGISYSSNVIPVVASAQSRAGSIDCVQWYPHDSGMFLTLSADKTLTIWDTNEMQVAEQFKFSSDIFSFHINEHSMKSLVAVTSKDNNVYLCDMNAGSKSHTLQGHKGAVFATKWSPRKESVLVSASSDGCIKVWDVRKAKSLLMNLKSKNDKNAHNGIINSLCFTSNGLKLLSYASDHTIKIWDMWYGKELMKIEHHLIQNCANRTVQMDIWSSGRDEILFVPARGDIEMFDLNTAEHVKTLSGHFSNVNACCYNEAFQELYSCSADYKILVWNYLRLNEEEETLKAEKYHQDSWSDKD